MDIVQYNIKRPQHKTNKFNGICNSNVYKRYANMCFFGTRRCVVITGFSALGTCVQFVFPNFLFVVTKHIGVAVTLYMYISGCLFVCFLVRLYLICSFTL
jgi:hypothetical protein